MKFFSTIIAGLYCIFGICLLVSKESTLPYQRFLGKDSISENLYNFILEHVEKKSTILELGSGYSSEILSLDYNVYSIENDPNFLNCCDRVHYIYAPIVNAWYDVDVLKRQLPIQYDVIIVDGPKGSIGRSGFFKHLNLFDSNALIIFDDVNRSEEYKLMQNCAKALKKKFTIITSGKKKWGYLHR